jgi:peptidoglycan hydrolase FlgJ
MEAMVSDSLEMRGIGQLQSRASSLSRMAEKGGADEKKMREAANEFESMFLAQMLEHMFVGVETNEMFGGGEAEDIYRSMMVEEYGKLIARSGGIGVSDHVMRQMMQMQEATTSGDHNQSVKGA